MSLIISPRHPTIKLFDGLLSVSKRCLRDESKRSKDYAFECHAGKRPEVSNFDAVRDMLRSCKELPAAADQQRDLADQLETAADALLGKAGHHVERSDPFDIIAAARVAKSFADAELLLDPEIDHSDMKDAAALLCDTAAALRTDAKFAAERVSSIERYQRRLTLDVLCDPETTDEQFDEMLVESDYASDLFASFELTRADFLEEFDAAEKVSKPIEGRGPPPPGKTYLVSGWPAVELKDGRQLTKFEYARERLREAKRLHAQQARDAIAAEIMREANEHKTAERDAIRAKIKGVWA